MRFPSSPELGFCGCREAAEKTSTERAQACGCGIEAKVGGDRDSTRPQRFRERLSNRKAKTGGRDYDDRNSPLFRRKKADRRACRQIPVAGDLLQKEYVDAGGLMSYGADYDDLYRRAAVYVDKILKGAKPADLPVQQATKFEFVINLKAAKQIGLTLSPSFLRGRIK